MTLYGGHRIETITCRYCGAVLDNNADYKVIKKFVGTLRPEMPFAIGMQGVFKGIPFTIIGVLQYEYIAEPYSWLEYLLFSPTHGYAWLEYENGHFIFSRKVRDEPEGVVTYYIKSRFKFRGKFFRVFETYSVKLSYVEGELTWEANQGDRLRLIDAINPPYIFTIEISGNEREYSLGEYLGRSEVYQAFSINPPRQHPVGIHAAQPYLPASFTKGLHTAGKYFSPLALFLFVAVLFLGSGTVVLRDKLNPARYLTPEGTLSSEFIISNADHLLKIELYSDLDNAWCWYDIEVISDKDQESIYSFAKEISYYQGYEGGSHWSEGRKSVSAYLKVPHNGSYRLRISGEGGRGEYRDSPQYEWLRVTVREGVIVSRYFLILLIICLASWFLLYYRQYSFEARRWKANEDDDD